MPDRMSAMQLFDFTERLTSKAPTPGGGGASALIGALAAALGAMAANLTMGKKKFLSFEQDHQHIIAETNILRLRFLELIDEDAAAFEPLSRAYSMDKTDPAYDETVRNATLSAAAVPYEIMRCCCELIELLENLKGKCSVLLLSDVGCAAVAAHAALESASMNVFVNTRLLPEDKEARALADAASEALEQYLPRAHAVADGVMDYLRAPKG